MNGGLGVGDWGLGKVFPRRYSDAETSSPTPTPQTPIPVEREVRV